MKRFLGLFIFCASLWGQSWYSTGGTWTGRKALVVDHRRVQSALTDFPVYVERVADSDLAGNLRPDCHDLLFTLADGTKLAHEILACDAAAGTVKALVTIPSLSATADTPILLYYGNASAANQENVTGVYDTATQMALNWKGNPNDSTSNGVNATVAAGAPAYVTDSPIGPAVSCNGTADHLTTASAPFSTGMTLSFWWLADMRPTQSSLIINLVGNSAFGFSWDGYSQWAKSLWFNWNGGSNPLWSGFVNQPPDAHRWYHAALTWDGTTARAYIDGGAAGSTAEASADSFTGGLDLCGNATYHSRAKLAHIVLANAARSTAWIATEYANQAHPDLFFRAGAAQTNTGTPAIETFAATYATVESGNPTVLYYVVKNAATSVSIDNGVGAQSNLVAGSVTVSPAATTTYTLTVDGSATATTTVTVPTTALVAYLRAGPPAASWIRTFTVDGSGHAIITGFEPHNLVTGEYVSIEGAVTTDAGNTHYHASNLNGKFQVADIVDSTSFKIKDLAGTAYIDPNDTALAVGSPGSTSGASFIGKVTPTPLVSAPRGVLFDGLTGPNTRRLGTSTNNGLTSLVVASGTGTITLGYDPASIGVASGGKVSIWGTTTSGDLANGAEFTIAGVTSSTVTFTTTAADGTYTTRAACGPSGGDPHTIGGTDNCVVVSFSATSANPLWAAVKLQSDAVTSSTAYTHAFDGGTIAKYDTSLAWDKWNNCAFRFWVDRANQNVLGCLTYAVSHFERYVGVGFYAVGESGNVGHFGERLASGIADVYTVPRTLGHLTSGDITHAIGTIMSSITDPAAQCTRPVPVTGSGTATISGTTVTGSGTSFSTEVHIGDAIQAGATLNMADPYPATTYYVSSVDSDTQLTVINGGAGGLGASPKQYVILAHWTTGNCGYSDNLGFQSAWLGVQPAQYGGSGGTNTADVGNRIYPTPYENTGAITLAYKMSVGGAFADDTPLGVRLHETGQEMYWSRMMATGMGLRGWNANGDHYGFGNEVFGQMVADVAMYGLAPTLPAPSGGSSYYFNPALLKVYAPYPDAANGVHPLQVWASSNTGQGSMLPGDHGADWVADVSHYFSHTGNASKYLRNFNAALSLTSSVGNTSGRVSLFAYYQPLGDATTDYKTQPLQFNVSPNASQIADCSRLTGWAECGHLQSGGFISKGPSGWTNRSASQVTVWGRSGKLGYDTPQPASLSIYSVGAMITSDGALPPGNSALNSYYQVDIAPKMDLPIIGTFPASAIRMTESTTDWLRSSMPRWAGGDSTYGDASNRYVYGMVDATEAYSPTYKRIHRHIAHFKKPGTEEVVISRWDIDATNFGTPAISVPTFYGQNGETGDSATNPSNEVNPYNEGSTTFPGGDCASLDSNRAVFTHGNGAAADAHGPARSTGVIAQLFSPGAITVTCDGTTYTGNNGHAYRVTASSLTGALDYIEVFKVTQDYTTDSTLTATALTPDANWTGVQTADKVAMFARGGVLRSSLAVTTTHSGTAQYLIAGVAAGTVSVSMNGTPVTGSPFTVADGDNTIYFESTAGDLSLNGAAPACSITTTSLPSGTVGVAYSQAVNTSNCTAPVSWTIASGSLCGGLSQDNTTGVISGTPTTAQTCSFTVQAVDSTPTTVTQPLSITINPAPGLGGSRHGGNIKFGGNIPIVH